MFNTESREKALWLIILVMAFSAIVCGWLTDGFSFLRDNTTDFFQEQQPGADSPGEFIAMQYSQLREYSKSLDDLACRVEINEAAQSDLQEIYGENEASWPADAREEARNLRFEHTALLQTYSKVAADYNNLRSDIRTLPDNLGLEVDEIPQAEALSPVPGMCGGFALPEANQ